MSNNQSYRPEVLWTLRCTIPLGIATVKTRNVTVVSKEILLGLYMLNMNMNICYMHMTEIHVSSDAYQLLHATKVPRMTEETAY